MSDMSDMAGMAGMGAMDMGMTNLFTPTNKKVAHLYWYFVAAVVGLLTLRRVLDRLRVFLSRRQSQKQPGAATSKLIRAFFQAYDTTIAIGRELSYPQIWTFTGRFTKYFTPPSLGRTLFIFAYWVVILTMLWSNTILTPSSPNYAYKWEIVGFRAAWVSVTQLPLIYILSGKNNVITLLTGISYERLNWLHRWVSRTMFLTVIVHWSYFFTEWSIADFVKLEMETMPMVKYGFGAWATLGWMVLTGLGFFRSACYELWVLQHIAAAMVLLWLVHSHVPSYAQYNVWFAVGIVVFDWALRAVNGIRVNFSLPTGKNTAAVTRRRRLGYEAEVTSLSAEFLRVKICDVRTSWRAGQHVFLSIPRAGILETHPFTIASVPESLSGGQGPNHIDLYIKVHNGFTRRLRNRCLLQQTPQRFLSFISEPRGAPPAIDRFESLILLATGNGASFTVPIFQQALLTDNSVRQVHFIWTFRQHAQLDWFKDQLLRACSAARHRDMKISIDAFITGEECLERSSSDEDCSLLEPGVHGLDTEKSRVASSGAAAVEDSHSHSHAHEDDEKHVTDSATSNATEVRNSSDSTPVSPRIGVNYGRPDLEQLILPVVEAAEGETGILACGGSAFTGSVRNYVARLSDERAVHKGTGAQGLYLFCETYGW